MIHQMWAYKSEKQTHSRVYPNNISCLEVINEDLLMSKSYRNPSARALNTLSAYRIRSKVEVPYELYV